MAPMVITTTNEVQDKKVVEYKGIVFGEVISGVNMFKDLGANLRNIFGGRSKGYENELLVARTNALEEMESRGMLRSGHSVCCTLPQLRLTS